MKPELEGLLKFGMSKSHHITIRQQISFARQFEKQINDAILVSKMAFSSSLLGSSLYILIKCMADSFRLHQ